jgi:hypothetical protein
VAQVAVDRHEVLPTEGLTMGSFLDTGQQGCFGDGSIVALHPDFAAIAGRCVGVGGVRAAGAVRAGVGCGAGGGGANSQRPLRGTWRPMMLCGKFRP